MKKTTGALAGLLLLGAGAVVLAQSGASGGGSEVYAMQKCSLCHSIGGKGGSQSLDGVGSRLNSDVIKKWIKSPKAMKADTRMKSYPNLPDKDLTNLVDYLLTLK